MKKSKILLCLGLGTLLSSTALMASPKQNELELKGLNVEKVENVQNKGFKGNKLRLHYYRDDGAYTGWNIWLWAGTDGGSGHTFDTLDGYGLCTTIDLTDAKYEGVKTFNYVVRLSTESEEWAAKDGTGKDRSFTIPDEVDLANDGYDVYFYGSNNKEIKDDNTYTASDDPGKNYIINMGRNNIEALTTKAQLQYSFEKDEHDNYTFSNMTVNFGAIIDKDYVNNLLDAKVTNPTLAVAVLKKADLDKDKTNTSAASAVWNKATYVTIREQSLSGFTLPSTDEKGTSSTGDYYMFSADLNYKAGTANYNDELYAVAYIEYHVGESRSTAMLKAKLCSVSSLADEYVASDAFSSFTVYAKESLMALSALND